MSEAENCVWQWQKEVSKEKKVVAAAAAASVLLLLQYIWERL